MSGNSRTFRRISDALGRRVEKKVENCGDWNVTHRYYHDGQRVVEERNGSGTLLNQFVWGQEYIDELIEVAKNYGSGYCDTLFYPLLDATYNVVGLYGVDAYRLLERYDYTPYGERTVFGDKMRDSHLFYPASLFPLHAAGDWHRVAPCHGSLGSSSRTCRIT